MNRDSIRLALVPLLTSIGALGCAAGDAPAAGEPAASQDGALPPTREEGQALLDRVLALYQPNAAAAPVAGTHSYIGNAQWDSDVVDANAAARPGKPWALNVFGGIVTSPAMTPDVLAAVFCHETGHLVSGFPFKVRPAADVTVLGTAIATEGQADYFATKDCLPRLWAGETDANARAFAALDPAIAARCTAAYRDRASQELCGRILAASLQTGRWIAGQYTTPAMPVAAPQFDTPDPTEVDVTLYGAHPSAQCRLDTFAAGALCDAKITGTATPGLVPPYGEFSAASQEAARPFACQTGAGARPRCWFQPSGVRTDCAGRDQVCTVQDGKPGVETCEPSYGPGFNGCEGQEVCMDAPDGAICAAPTSP
jgi:hypothetical protein